jgi:hypothetical protein
MNNLEPYRHFFLYAKGHYKRSNDIFRDLSIIVSDMFLISYGKNKNERKNDVFRIMLKIIEDKKLLNYQGNSFSSFMIDIFPTNTWTYGYEHNQGTQFISKKVILKDYDYIEAVIRKCLSILSSTENHIFGELGTIDKNIQRKIFILQNIEELKNSRRI